MTIGQVVTTQLRVNPTTTKQVKCYSSHPSLAFFDNNKKPITILPGDNFDLKVNVKTFSSKTSNVIVNCVDVERKELVNSWILKLIGSEPQITKRYELVAKCGYESNQKFIFENRTTVPCIYEFISANPDILQVKPLVLYNLLAY